MHSSPPVVYPLGRSHSQAWVLLAIWAAGLLAVLVWFRAGPVADWKVLLALVSVLLAGVAAFAGWKNSPIGQLAWDGRVWRWESSGYQSGVAEQRLTVIADFQSLLLLRLENQAHARLWLWVERGSFPERWMDLRRAVYSPHRSSPSSRWQTHETGSELPVLPRVDRGASVQPQNQP